MFDGESLVSLFFRLLNFILLGSLGIYLFKRYGLSVIHARIKEKESALAQLKQQRDTLKGTMRSLEHQRFDQDLIAAQLSAKIERWQRVYQTRERVRYEEKQRLITLLTKKIHEQTRNNELATVQRRVFPVALLESRKQLTQSFQNPEKGDDFIQHLLSFMETGKP